jgi:transposase InsO family protein
MAQLVILAVTVEGRSKSEVARDYGVSRRWVQTLVARYAAEGEAAFAPRSRRPHSTPHKTAAEVEDRIVALRKELDDAGHDAGAETIGWHLEQRYGSAPATSTIWRVLSRRGFVTPQPHKRPRSSWRTFTAELPNECWQADITHWTLPTGVEVEILNIIDDHSRLLVGCTARPVFKAHDVVTDLRAAIATYGRPERMLTDNGAVFTGQYRFTTWVALERELVGHGIGLTHSRPYHPQTCGKVERFHQTLKKWLRKQRPARSLRGLQTQLDRTAASAAAPRRPPGTPGPARSRPDKANASTPTSGSAATRSTATANSPCATTAGSTTSASAAATPAPAS